jgi:diguanylate cyclase (GGDEF)-like protein
MRQSRYVIAEPERSAWLSQRCDHWQQISAMYVDVWADGRVFEMSISQAQDGSHVGIYKDITERHTEERRLTHLAYHDALTNLHNRKFFMEELHKLTPQHCAAVLYIDLDGFKRVNDTLGHDFGDEVLKHVAQNLSTCLRSADIAARIGGDEFCALLSNVKTQAEVLPVIERLFARIGSTHTFEGRTGTFGLSIGCAFYPDDGTTPDDIVSAADQAMYAAKNAGKGTYRFYTRL